MTKSAAVCSPPEILVSRHPSLQDFHNINLLTVTQAPRCLSVRRLPAFLERKRCSNMSTNGVSHGKTQMITVGVPISALQCEQQIVHKINYNSVELGDAGVVV